MITIFTVPRSFIGHMGLIQRNAILSWKQLKPDCEIILLGDEEGVAEASRELGVKHVPEVKRNEYGTPYQSDIFEQAEKAASNEILCFVNTDIILLSNFTSAVERIREKSQKFVMIGRRWNFDLFKPLDFHTGWEEELRSLVHSKGEMAGPAAIDYVVFTRGIYGKMPPFVIGRPRNDNYLIYSARRDGVMVVDASGLVDAFHESHDYKHVPQGKNNTVEGPEAVANRELYGIGRPCYTIYDANFVLVQSGLKRSFYRDSIKHEIKRLLNL